MRLDNLYMLARSIKNTENYFKKGMEITYYLEPDIHEQLQKECYIKTKNSLTGYAPQKNFELYLLDIKFVFKSM